MNIGFIANLSLLRTLLAIGEKFQKAVSWKWWTLVLLAYANLVASRLLASLNFSLDSEGYSGVATEKSYFYELCQEHKCLKMMKMSVGWSDF